ncbi:hypothetical protein CDAR_618061 [Caerostris darwini]|uniref:Uncharacterized protein n=1 Tax=Caerostris darwini TaxID=1538125 RepID=A0AAV4U905_9ARAC|nr:hypothetical protein CDAR_618061 [Caerostris darwini]
MWKRGRRKNIFPDDPERASETIPFAGLITTAHYENTNGEIQGNKRQSSVANIRKSLRNSPIPNCTSTSFTTPFDRPSHNFPTPLRLPQWYCLTTEKFKAKGDKLQRASCN